MTAVAPPNLVPLPITVGLAVFAGILSLAGFIFLPPDARPLSTILTVFAVYVLAVPLAFVLGGWVMRQVNGDAIHWRNALSLGLLVSVVAILWKMGTGV
ncbi:MAG: hypothetical protein RLY58_1316 [Pseudomonadota bacterium]|jgi:O-antigen/teichoic acid export membrane protein